MEPFSNIPYPVGTEFLTNSTELYDTTGNSRNVPEGSIATVVKVIHKKYTIPYYVYDVVIDGIRYDACGVSHFKGFHYDKSEINDNFWVEE